MIVFSRPPVPAKDAEVAMCAAAKDVSEEKAKLVLALPTKTLHEMLQANM